ncbi:MAG: FixH family protein [Pseudomonadota bacterium]|nr:FixH family protein [Pseudomonadota bacterium]
MDENQSQPWWKFGHVWLVLAGPAVVVVASFITLYLAISIPDPVITDAKPQALAPAMQARNHAATGVPVPSKP